MKQELRALALLWAGGLLGSTAWADDAALRRCRGLSDAAARLACYDALPLPTLAAPAAVPGVSAAAVASALPLTPVPPVVPLVPTALTAPAQPATPDAAFGLESRSPAVQEIVSRIDGLFEGWDPRSRIRLANGQVWQVIDGSTAAVGLRSPRVTVRRAALGSFMMDIEGLTRAPRVRRVE